MNLCGIQHNRQRKLIWSLRSTPFLPVYFPATPVLRFSTRLPEKVNIRTGNSPIAMMPGKMNSREVKRMMAQMGIKSTDLTDVKKVIFEGAATNIVVTDAAVMKVEAKGEVYFQVSGKISTEEKKAAKKQEPEVSQEDVTLIMEQTHVNREKAVEALKKANGEVAQAIIDLMEK